MLSLFNRVCWLFKPINIKNIPRKTKEHKNNEFFEYS